MEKSAGIAIILKPHKKILICKAKGHNSWTPPKGHVEDNESYKQAAIRETFEEVGIAIHPNTLTDEYFEVRYKTPKGKTRKIVYLFTYEVNDLSKIGNNIILPDNMIQQEEIEIALFLDFQTAKSTCLKHYADYFVSLEEKYV